MKKIIYLAVISAGLLLQSCSMTKDAGNTAMLNSQKLQSKQVVVNGKIDQKAPSSTCQNLPEVKNQAELKTPELPSVATTTPKKVKLFKQSIKDNLQVISQSKVVKSASLAYKQTINDGKKLQNYSNLLKQKSNAARVTGIKLSDHNYLVYGLISLALGIICGIIAGIILASYYASFSTYVNGVYTYQPYLAYPFGATILIIFEWIFYAAAGIFLTIWLLHFLKNM